RRELGAVGDRAEIVAVEQLPPGRADRTRGRRHRPLQLPARDFLQAVAIAAELLEDRVGEGRAALAGGDADRRAALHDGAVKEALRRRHRQENADLTAAARLAEDRDVAGVAAEPRDVVADP